MKWIAAITVATALTLTGTIDARAADTGAFEVVAVPPATSDIATGTFRVNVATGQVVNFWGGATTYNAIPDASPLPAGAYHLRVIEVLDQKGGWSLLRLDGNSGRMWMLSGGGSNPFSWYEVTPAQ